ncbi:hypothetical protein [Vibrio marisflavi]|uniref:Uncharacterized protein n=1 Tax=Vibrio marisflavi CECT 7928 TaxID=634439 RepID=A0ABN8E9L2_9VIBR|nr:hypothetical protein [Vibrio marisflavi]CAH0541067.1 hypothetical protein VMF7928_03349 [Vibrio marisflavi CECT 7928]
MKKALVLGAALLALSGCSTMFNNGSQTILATSSNPDKKVKVDITTPSGSYQTYLPATIVAKPSSSKDVAIKINTKCYDSSTVVVNKTITPSYWANLLNGWGFIIDAMTGDMWKYDNQVVIPAQAKPNCAKS